MLQPRAGQRPEPQPDRGRLRRARHGGRHGRDGQAAPAPSRRLARRLRRRPRRKHQLDAFFDAPIRTPARERCCKAPPRASSTTSIASSARSRRTPTTRRSGSRLRRHAGPRDPRQRSAAAAGPQDPAQLLLLRRLRPRDPEEDPGRARAGGRRRPAWSTRAGSAAAGRSSTTRASRSASTSRSSAPRTGFEFGVQVGVSPVLFYDPVERVVATLHPEPHLREGGVRPLAADDLRRQRHRHARTPDRRSDVPIRHRRLRCEVLPTQPDHLADLACAAHRRRARPGRASRLPTTAPRPTPTRRPSLTSTRWAAPS